MSEAYRRQVAEEIRAWEARGPSLVQRLGATLQAPLDHLMASLVPPAALGEILSRIEDSLASLYDDSRWVVDQERIQFEVAELTRELGCAFEASDRVARRCWQWNVALAGTTGAVSGAMGWVGLIVDVPALGVLTIRTMLEIAACYRLEVSASSDPAFVLQILELTGTASTPRPLSAALEIKKLEQAILTKALAAASENAASAAAHVALTHAARALGTSVIQRKLLQLVPVIGGIASGGYNAWFLNDLAETAYMACRRRYLSQHAAALALRE